MDTSYLSNAYIGDKTKKSPQAGQTKYQPVLDMVKTLENNCDFEKAIIIPNVLERNAHKVKSAFCSNTLSFIELRKHLRSKNLRLSFQAVETQMRGVYNLEISIVKSKKNFQDGLNEISDFATKAKQGEY